MQHQNERVRHLLRSTKRLFLESLLAVEEHSTGKGTTKQDQAVTLFKQKLQLLPGADHLNTPEVDALIRRNIDRIVAANNEAEADSSAVLGAIFGN